MKRGENILFYLVIFLLFLFVSFNVSAVEIDSCQTLSGENTIYTLNTSVNFSDTCFVINANNITLD
jgi:hypothetical protein